jgi:L-alanine-DL-glutamate epimerase-like enolase superfamily enzyme
MRITRVDWDLLHVPLPRTRLPMAGVPDGRPERVVVLLARLDTDAGLHGLGVAYALQGSGRALYAAAVDDVTPLLTGEDPLDHERLAARAYWRLHTVGRRGLVAQAYSAADLALWDLKGKAANLPLYKLLGGTRPSAPAFGSDAGWLGTSPGEVVDAARPLLERGLMGIKVMVGAGPEEDADRLTQLRAALGDDIWLAVDAGQRYDSGTALAMGRFFEEEVGADWFEDPLPCEDVPGHARLASKLDVPLAAGGALFGRDEFAAYLGRDALAVARPDVTRLGGLTAWLKAAALAEQHGRPVVPHLLPEVGVQLACGLPGVTAVEYVPWLEPLWAPPPRFDGGKLAPPADPGLGLEVNPEAVARFRLAV